MFSVIYEQQDESYSFENIRDLMSIFPEAVTSANKEQLIMDLKTHGFRLLQEVFEVIKIDVPENIFEAPDVIQAFKVLEYTLPILIEYNDSSQSCLKNWCADDQMPLVFYAAIKGDAVLLSKLLKENPSLVNLGHKGNTLLGMSLLFANQECTKLLMSNRDIDLNIKNYEGDNVLAASTTMKDFSIIESLLSRGVDIDSVNDQYISAADKILYQFRSSDKYQDAVALVRSHSRDPMHSLLSIGQNYTNYQLDQSKSNVAIVVASGFWSMDPFAMARRAIAQHRGLQVFVITKDQADEEFLTQFNGFIIPGGADSFPKKQEFVINDIEHMSEGESLYKHVLSVADKNLIPVMGMCLGNQYIGLYGGATLYPSKGHNGGNHKGRFVSGTLPYFMSLSVKEQQHVLDSKYYPDINFSIDTAHNFAVVENKPGNVKIGAFSEVGVVQAISYNNHVIGFQFHPENDYGLDFNIQGIRSTNLINNFMLLACQHSQWHNFAKANGFTYQEAQNALQHNNDALLDEIKFGTLAQCRVLEKNSKEWVIENLAQSNITYAEFSWPSPTLESFPQGECEVPSDVCKVVFEHNISEQKLNMTAVYVPVDSMLGEDALCYIGDQV